MDRVLHGRELWALKLGCFVASACTLDTFGISESSSSATTTTIASANPTDPQSTATGSTIEPTGDPTATTTMESPSTSNSTDEPPQTSTETTHGTGATPTCGDGAVEGEEECDDGNLVPHDGCEPYCRPTPPRVVLAAGDRTCVKASSGVRCWGYGKYGQLGLGSVTTYGDDELPSSAPDGELNGTVVQLGLGGVHACAVMTGAEVRCWGWGKDGRLGYGNTEDIGDDEPPNAVGFVDVGGLALEVSGGGHHTCALLVNGDVRCWGWGDHGRLGQGNLSNIGDVDVPGDHPAVSLGGKATRVAAGGAHVCALLEGGSVRCWGINDNGELGLGHIETIGDDELPSSEDPVDLGGPAVQIAAGGRHTCALLVGGDIRCWGEGTFGALGLGTPDHVGDDESPSDRMPVPLGGPAIFVTAAGASGDHSCAILADGALRCWGYGHSGELGYGDANTIGDYELPTQKTPVALGGNVVQVATGGTYKGGHTCVFLDDETLRCWGRNEYGQIGYGNTGGATCLDGMMSYECSMGSVCCVGDAAGEMPPSPVQFE